MMEKETKTFARTARQGFTLIELLVVILIIAILAGLILSTAGFVQRKGATARAETEIAALSAALESYKAEYGAYPSNTAASPATRGANILFNALVVSNPTHNPLGKVFFEPSKSMLGPVTNMTDTNNLFVDPFGSPYQYRSDSAATNNGSNFFDLWSYGGAGSNASDAPKWIKNW